MICFPFKPTRIKDGKRCVCRYYSGKIKLDTWANARVFALHTTDIRVARHKLAEMVHEFEREALGLLPPRSVRDAFKRPLVSLLEDFLADLRVKGASPGTLRKYGGTLRILFQRLSWSELRGVTARAFVQWRTHANLSPKTLNDLLANMGTFYSWLIANRFADSNPLEHVGRIDTRRAGQCRRALSEDEQARLLSVAPPWRALVYEFVLSTGLRRKEMNGIRWSDLIGLGELSFLPLSSRLDACKAAVRGSGAKGAPVSQDTEVPGEVIADTAGRNPAVALHLSPRGDARKIADAPRQQPSVRVPAALAKNARESHLPLRAALVARLLAAKPADAAEFQYVFRGRVPRIETFYRDLSSAGIPVCDSQGRRVDFHALRATFGTTLLARGVHAVVVKELMRHSDLKLTLRLYTDVSQLPLRAGVESLPDLRSLGSLTNVKKHTQKHTHAEAADGHSVSQRDAARRAGPGLQTA